MSKSTIVIRTSKHDFDLQSVQYALVYYGLINGRMQVVCIYVLACMTIQFIILL